MPPSRQTLPLLWSRLTPVLTLLILTALAGCGPASSDNQPGPGSRASGGGPSLSKQSPSPGNNPLNPVIQTASPVTISSVNGTGAPSGIGAVPEGDKLPIPSIPDSIAKDLGSPDALTRYRALDHWETKGTQAPLDPVFEALEDKDEAVRAKATAILERHWAMEQEREEREMKQEREKG